MYSTIDRNSEKILEKMCNLNLSSHKKLPAFDGTYDHLSISKKCKFKKACTNEVLALKDGLRVIDKNRIRTFTPRDEKNKSLQAAFYRAGT